MLKETETEETICFVDIIFIFDGISIGEGGRTLVLPSSSSISFLSLLEFCKICLLLCYKTANCRVANGTESNGLNRIFENNGVCEKGLEHVFMFSHSSHFFSKTDFEQYISLQLFKCLLYNAVQKLCQYFSYLLNCLLFKLFRFTPKDFSHRQNRLLQFRGFNVLIPR